MFFTYTLSYDTHFLLISFANGTPPPHTQIKNKSKYNKNIIPHGGIQLVISDNILIKINDGNGFVHPNRKKQYIQLIQNCLLKYYLPNGNININLGDKPMNNVLNFCRKVNNNNCFLIPGFRFTNDDIILSNKCKREDYPTFTPLEI